MNKQKLQEIFSQPQYMLDIETLGNTHDAAVVQISLVRFTLAGWSAVFKATINFDDALKYGKASGSTINWWLQQSDEARYGLVQVTNDSHMTLKRALEALTSFIEVNFKPISEDSHIWCHATFDAPILANAFAARDLPLPYKFWQIKDLRTMDLLFGPNTIKRDGTHHDSACDAIYQIENLIAKVKAFIDAN